MENFSFVLRDANNQKHAREVSFPSTANPMVSQFVTELSDEIDGLEDSETVRLYNRTRDKMLVEGPLLEQITENDEVVYSTEGSAGSLS